MSFLRRLFGPRGNEPDEVGQPAGEAVQDGDMVGWTDPHPELHAVTVWLPLSDPELVAGREQMRMFALEDRLMKALDASGAGAFDTNDLERGFLRMHLYGPDADRIVEVVRPVLADAPAGSYLAKRRGPGGTSEERVDLTRDGA